MGLDLLLFQADKEGDPELIKHSQTARFKSVEIIDEIQEDYKQWTRVKFNLDNTNKIINATQKEIGKIIKAHPLLAMLTVGKRDCNRVACQKSRIGQGEGYTPGRR